MICHQMTRPRGDFRQNQTLLARCLGAWVFPVGALRVEALRVGALAALTLVVTPAAADLPCDGALRAHADILNSFSIMPVDTRRALVRTMPMALDAIEPSLGQEDRQNPGLITRLSALRVTVTAPGFTENMTDEEAKAVSDLARETAALLEGTGQVCPALDATD